MRAQDRPSWRRATAIALAALAIACDKGATVDPLADLAPGDTECRSLPPRQPLRSGVVETYSIIRRSDPTSNLLIGIDSARHPRMFGAFATSKRGNDKQFGIQSIVVMYDTLGAMSMPLRTTMNRDAADGSGDSKSVPLSPADTARARALTTEMMKRCVR